MSLAKTIGVAEVPATTQTVPFAGTTESAWVSVANLHDAGVCAPVGVFGPRSLPLTEST